MSDAPGLTAEGCRTRRRRLWEAVPDDCQWLLVADPRHVHYLANFWLEPLSFSFGERAILLLERDGPAILAGDNFTIRKATSPPHVDEQIVETWYDHRHAVVNRDHALAAAVGQLADRLRGRPGLVEHEWLPTLLAEQLPIDPAAQQAVSLGDVIRRLRRQKEPDEIELLRRSMRATDAGHRRALEVVAPGKTELEIYAEVHSAAILEAGYAAIVYGDFRATNAGEPKAGGLPTAHELQQGDLFLLDYTVMLAGYRSDFTNAVAVATPTAEQEALFDVVSAALAAGEQVLKADAEAKEVYAAVSKILEDAGHGPLKHHAGHGIGLAHPEPPILTPESDDRLLAGDVVTLEPGLYVEGIGGIRLEHNYLITDTGYERLSNHELSLTPP